MTLDRILSSRVAMTIMGGIVGASLTYAIGTGETFRILVVTACALGVIVAPFYLDKKFGDKE